MTGATDIAAAWRQSADMFSDISPYSFGRAWTQNTNHVYISTKADFIGNRFLELVYIKIADARLYGMQSGKPALNDPVHKLGVVTVRMQYHRYPAGPDTIHDLF